jgi:putative flippase GtrA
MPFSKRSILTFVHYTLWSTMLFIPEYILFLVLLKYTHIHYVAITVGTFMFGITLQYTLVRRFVFANTICRWQTGYALFVLSSCVGAGLIALFMVILVEVAGVPQYIARVIAGAGAGYLVYLFNVYSTFRASSRSPVS